MKQLKKEAMIEIQGGTLSSWIKKVAQSIKNKYNDASNHQLQARLLMVKSLFPSL
tara:strand:+ start:294 stop:458 length:165 start_codon:yes stop_codon:yes gene_type:complete